MNIKRARTIRARAIKDLELYRGAAERKPVNESACRLVGEHALYIAGKLEKSTLKVTLVIRLLLLSNNKDILTFKVVAQSRG